MRQLSYPGRSNVLAQNGMAATSNPLSSAEAINILQLDRQRKIVRSLAKEQAKTD